MTVGVQMIHAVFIAALAFGAVAELQILSVQLRASADRTLVPGRSLGLDFHFPLKLLLTPDLLWRISLVVPGHQKEDDHIGQGEQDH